MITLKFGDKRIQLQEDLTIKQWRELHKKNINNSKQRTELLSIFTGLDVNELKKLPKDNVNFIETYLRETLLKTEKPNENFVTFEFQGQTYGLENNWSQLTWGAWVDFEILTAENLEQNIPHIMSILFRPVERFDKKGYILKPYDPDDVLKRAELFEELPVKYWWWSSDFFLRAAELYITDTKNSLKLKTKMMKWLIKGKMILPKFLQEKLPLGFTLH